MHLLKLYSILIVTFFTTTCLLAQDHHRGQLGDTAGISKKDSMQNDDMSGMDMSGDKGMRMSHSFSLNLPMNRNGSGTSWLPDASPMYGYMKHVKGWMLMFHGDIFVRYNKQDLTHQGSRGGQRWDAPDMIMGMAQKQIGTKGLFHFNLMVSTDAIITGGYGYPLLYQTGESWKGQPLVDRQHPHDLFSEVSVSYAYAISKKSDLFIYLGYPGEPAIGPVTFMHRPSAMFMPDAPIGHHWEDATHITFGVATLGYRYGKFKLEASSFTGREPNENRFDFDKPLFDSWSGRLSFNPNANWALQISHAYIKSPEALNPEENVNRTTASVTYAIMFNEKTSFSTTALWGQNKVFGQIPSNALLLEAGIRFDRLVFYTRYEWVQKSVEELNLDASYGKNDKLFPLNTVTLGSSYNLFSIVHVNVDLGLQGSLYASPRALQSLYGTIPLAGEIFLHFYPGRMM